MQPVLLFIGQHVPWHSIGLEGLDNEVWAISITHFKNLSQVAEIEFPNDFEAVIVAIGNFSLFGRPPQELFIWNSLCRIMEEELSGHIRDEIMCLETLSRQEHLQVLVVPGQGVEFSGSNNHIHPGLV